MSNSVKLFIDIATITFTVLAFLSQTIVTFKEKSAKGISWISQTIITTGSLFWLSFATFNSHLSTGVVNIILIPMATYITYISFRDNGKGLNIYKKLFVLFVIVGFLTLTPLFLISITQGAENNMFSNDIGGMIAMYIGGSCTAFAFFPQTIKSIRTKNVENLSLLMPLFYMIAQALWTVVFSTDIVSAVESGNTVQVATSIFALITAIIPFLIYVTLTYLKIKFGNIKNESILKDA